MSDLKTSLTGVYCRCKHIAVSENAMHSQGVIVCFVCFFVCFFFYIECYELYFKTLLCSTC